MSENSVPLNPMVFMIIIPFLNGYFIGNIPNIFRQTYINLLYDLKIKPQNYSKSGGMNVSVRKGDAPEFFFPKK